MKQILTLSILLAGACLVPPVTFAKDKEAPVSESKKERMREENVRKAREKMAADSKEYRRDDYTELEQTYQKGNANPRLAENQEFLKTVVEKFPKSNRAGCAALYLARYTRGDDQEKYLKLALKKYSDCYYGDGTSVGAYARLIEGMRLTEKGSKSAAKKLFEEIKKDYPTAMDHGGRLIVESIPE